MTGIGKDASGGLLEQRLTRRSVIRGGIGAAGMLALGPGLLGSGLEAMAAPAQPGPGPYGPLGVPDVNNLRLPAGFSSRVIARGNQPLSPSPYVWHVFPDAMGTYATDDGGFILTSNSEVRGGLGGASAIRFDSEAKITSAYRILSGTSTNCAGAVTPWGTWLSCEEEESGRVWECDPTGAGVAVVRPAMGVFKHEAACVDPVGRQLYMTEDLGDSGFYRFTPSSYPDLSMGLLEIAVVGADGIVTWIEVPDPSAATTPTRMQVPDTTRFNRGEGMWFDDGIVYFATTSDDRVFAYHVATRELELLYDGEALGDAAPLHDTDNITVSPKSGELFVAEDADDLQLCVITPQGEVAPFAQLIGNEHTGSEVTGPVFDPSGQRLYFSSQRGWTFGVIFEVSGPFTQQRPGVAPPASDGSDGSGLPLGATGGLMMKLRVLGKPTVEGLLRSGLPVRVLLGGDQPARVQVKLLADLGGARPSSLHRGGKVIAQAKAKIRDQGKLVLRPLEDARPRLAGIERLRGRLVATAVSPAGAEERVKRIRLG
jgi:uncharacterized protein